VLPVFEQYNGMLYYPTSTRLEQSKNVIYTVRSDPADSRGLNWCRRRRRQDFYLLGRLHLAQNLEQDRAQAHRERAQDESAGRGVFPVGNTQFNSVINKMKLASRRDLRHHRRRLQRRFYKQLKAAGIDLTSRP